MGIGQFSKIAPYLTNPLVLIGFCLFLFYGLLWALLKSGLLSRLSQRQSSVVIRMILQYGFRIAIVAIGFVVLGVAYVGFQAHRAASGHQGTTIIQQSGSCNSVNTGDGQSSVNCDNTKATPK
jgi:hypothetical protein